MKLAITLLSALLFPLSALAEKADKTSKLTPQQIDRVLVIDRLASREEDTRRLAAVAYTVHNAQALAWSKFSKDLVLQGTTPSGHFDRDSKLVLANPSGSTYPLDEVARRKAAQLDGYSLRGSTIESVADFSVNAATLLMARKYPLQAAGVKLLYPPIKEATFRLVERDPRAPGFERDFTAEWAVWAYDQVRRKTPEGLALAAFVDKYQGVDPTKDNSILAPVQQASERLLLIKTSKTANEALSKIENIGETQTALLGGVTSIQQQLANSQLNAANSAAALEAKIRPVQNLAGSLQLTSYLFTVAGNNDGARTIGELANATNGVANLMESAATAAPMVLAAGYVGVALAVVSAFQKAHEGPSPFPAIFEMLSKLSEQVESLRHQIANSIADLDVHLSVGIDVLTVKVDAQKYETEQIGLQIRDLQSSVKGLSEAVHQQFASVSDLILRSEDRNCFQWTGETQLLPLSRRDFIICRDTYIDRATIYAFETTPSNPSSASTASIRQVLFPFSSEYHRLKADVGQNGEPIVNPALWYRSTTLLLALVQSSSQYLQDVLVDQLDSAMKGGDDLKQFVQTLALDGTNLRRDRFETLIDHISATQTEILNKAERQLNKAGVIANVAQPDPNIDRPYRMLATKGLKFCAGTKPNLRSVQNVSVTRSGGCCGTDEIVNQSVIDNANIGSPGLGWGNLRGRVEGALRSVDYSALSLDKSILRSINRAVILMEQTKHKNAEMSYCVSQFDVTRLNMTHAMQTEVGLDVHVKVFLTTEGTTGSATFLVQELAGAREWKNPLYHLYYDGNARPNALIFEPWKQLSGTFDQFLKAIPNGEADTNRKVVEDEIDKFFSETRSTAYQNSLNGTVPEARQYNELKRQLLLLTKVGLNANHPAVQAWIEDVESTYQSVESQIASIVLRGELADNARSAAAYRTSLLKDSLSQLGKYQDLQPDTTPISARLNDLQKLRMLRASLDAPVKTSKFVQ